MLGNAIIKRWKGHVEHARNRDENAQKFNGPIVSIGILASDIVSIDKELDVDRLALDVKEIYAILRDPVLLEALADIEHARWSGWEKWRANNATLDAEQRWERQRNTTYASLSEHEKDSDRTEARKGIATICAFMSAKIEAKLGDDAT